MNNYEVRMYSGLKVADSFADFWTADISAYKGGVSGFFQPGSLQRLATGCSSVGGFNANTCNDWTDATSSFSAAAVDARGSSSMDTGGELFSGSPTLCNQVTSNGKIPCMCYVGS